MHERQSELERHGQGREPAQPVVGVDEVVACLLAPGELRYGFSELVGDVSETVFGNQPPRASREFVQQYAIGELCDARLPGGPGDEINLDPAHRQLRRGREQGNIHATGVSAARECRRRRVHRYERYSVQRGGHETTVRA